MEPLPTIRYYLIVLLALFLYMYHYKKTWYNNKFVFYVITVYLPIMFFTVSIL